MHKMIIVQHDYCLLFMGSGPLLCPLEEGLNVCNAFHSAKIMGQFKIFVCLAVCIYNTHPFSSPPELNKV